MSAIKHAVITSFLSKTKDRFHEYNEELDLEGRLKMASEMQGVSGVEVVFPYEVEDDPAEMRRLLSRYELGIGALNVNIKAEPEFRNGGLTAHDAGARDRAVEFIKNAKDYAIALGANKVTCCPLADGYEFSFQSDYRQTWKRAVDAVSEAADYKREMPLFIEYKPSETRARCYLDTAAKTLCLLNDVGIKETGITLDVGHSLYGGENPAEALCLIAESGFGYYLHINDNNAKWDWDHMVGAHHLVHYIEFLYYAQEYEYDDFMTSDTSPTRWDIKGSFEMNSRVTQKLWDRLLQIDREKLASLIANESFLDTWRFVEEEILKL